MRDFFDEFNQVIYNNFDYCEREFFTCLIEANENFDPARTDALLAELNRLKDE